MSAPSNRLGNRLTALPIVLALAGTALVGAPAADAAFGVATFSAYVKKNGKTAESTGVKKTRKKGRGKYDIKFSRRVNKCYYSATIRGKHGGQVSIVRANHKKKLKVFTYNKSGSRSNKRFYIVVYCNH